MVLKVGGQCIFKAFVVVHCAWIITINRYITHVRTFHTKSTYIKVYIVRVSRKRNSYAGRYCLLFVKN